MLRVFGYFPSQAGMFLCGLWLLAGSGGVLASSDAWQPLQGEFAVTGEHLIDPPPEAPANSHFRMVLRGKSAEALFHNMLVEPSEDLCTGAEARRIGELVCLRFEKEQVYECDFSIRLKTQEIHFGRVC